MNFAVFCSGKGTNLQAIIDALKRGEIKANLALVISDQKDAYCLVRAKTAGVETVFIDPQKFSARENFDKEVIRHLERKTIELICLAGFMRIISPYLVQRYKNRILNIHPALLPSFKGTKGVKEALEYGVKITGPTVHFVDEKMDHGPIVLQAAVEVRDDDTEETLAQRIHAQEYIIYPQAVKLFVEGKLKIEGRKVKII